MIHVLVRARETDDDIQLVKFNEADRAFGHVLILERVPVKVPRMRVPPKLFLRRTKTKIVPHAADATLLSR